MDVKQVIVIRKDLKMRRGKECAQASHASMAWLTNRIRQSKDDLWFSPAEEEWINGPFAKIVLQAESEQQLQEIFQAAKNACLEAHLIIDVGRTEFNGIPTVTAVGIGPDEVRKIDAITGQLKLY